MIELGQRRLDEAAELARGLIAGLPRAGLMVVDQRLRILLIEGDVHRDVDSEAVLGRLVPDVVPAAAWPVLAPRYLGALNGRAQSFEYDAVSDSSTHWVRLSSIRDGAEIVGVLLVTQDITERASANRRLAESERRQAAVLEALNEGVVVVDTEGRVVEANAAASEILGLGVDLTRRSRWWEPLAARVAGPTAPLDIARRVLQSGVGTRDVALEIDRPGGVRASLSVNYLPWRDHEDRIAGLVLSFRDVTEHDAEVQRRTVLEDRLREAHEVARLASWEWQPERNEVEIFQALTPETTPLGVKTTLDELLSVMAADEREAAYEDLVALQRGERDEFVRRHRHARAPGERWLETRGRAVRDEAGGLLSVRGTSQDVTEQELSRQQLIAGRDIAQATLDSLPSNVAVLDGQGAILMTNRAWKEFATANGGDPDAQGANYLAVCDAARSDESAAEVARGLRDVLSGARTEFSTQYACHGPTAKRWFVLRAARYDGPGDARLVVTSTDVTERHWEQAQVGKQAALLDEVDIAVIATDAEGSVTDWNHGAEQLYGIARSEAVGQRVDALITGTGPDAVTGLDGGLRHAGAREAESVVRRQDGSTFPALIRDRVMQDADGRLTGMIGVSMDISDRVESERALLEARDYSRAVADAMTEGLFTLDCEGVVTYVNQAAATMLGWPAGEMQGRNVHELIHAQRGDGSVLVVEDSPIARARRDGTTARVEDDVFNTRAGRALAVAYTAAPFETDAGVQGCAVVFRDITERKAVEAGLRQDVETLAWIERVQAALAEDRFVLYAQPIVDLASGEVVQRELLLRLREPDGQIIGPGAFLGIAEQYGLIGDIDRWVISEATRIAATGTAVELNLSACSIGDPGILDHIERAIEQSGVDPSLLVFEITETAIVANEQAARVFADRLRALGSKLALDDFGTGYGSFTYLKQIPVDYLKIDVEFVRDLATDTGSRHVVEAVVALARGFELQTVGEGVEDARTLELLGELGVDFAQGYHLARPAPIELTLAATGHHEQSVNALTVDAGLPASHHRQENTSPMASEQRGTPERADVRELSLAALRETAIGAFAGRAEGRDVTFTVDLSERLPLVVMIDPDRTRRLLEDVLAQVLRSTERGPVSLQIQRGVCAPSASRPPSSELGATLELRITTPDDCLELSAYDDLVRLLEGEMEATSAPEGGTVATISLPLRTPVADRSTLDAG